MFITNWFEKTGKNNFEKHIKFFSIMKNLRFLEIGCFEGMASVWMLKNVLIDVNSTLDVIDTFSGSIEHQKEELKIKTLKDRFLENTVLYHKKMIIHVGHSHKILRTLEKQFDFIYIDGSHQASDVIEDAILAFRILKPNGIMAFDDYKFDNIGNALQHPKIAIDAFITLFADKIQIIEKNYQLFIRKNDI